MTSLDVNVALTVSGEDGNAVRLGSRQPAALVRRRFLAVDDWAIGTSEVALPSPFGGMFP